MRRSTERILTTHVGSLVRPPDVLEDILKKVAGKPVDEAAFQAKVRKGVAEVVRKQAEIGIDIPSDGEFSKPTFTSYVAERLERPRFDGRRSAKPYTYAMLQESSRASWRSTTPCTDDVDAGLGAGRDRPRRDRRLRRTCAPSSPTIRYQGADLVQRDIDNFKAALEGLTFVEAFMPVGDAVAQRRRRRSESTRARGLSLRARRRDARGVQGDRRCRLRRAARPRPAGAQPGAARQAEPDLGGAAPRLGDADRGLQPRPARASRRTACATTSAGAA